MGGFCVVKADGLAAGKGVVVADTAEEAKQAATEMLGGVWCRQQQVLIEERMTGPEASLFALVDGADCLFMASAQDHKRAFDQDQVQTQVAWARFHLHPVDDALRDQVMAEIVEPLARGMADEERPIAGCSMSV